MNKNEEKIDVFLLPGDFHFAGKETRIQTLLGSCIAIVIWHPEKLIGGMCHYMLPSSGAKQDQLLFNGKYAEDAIKMFLQEIKVAGTTPCEYHTKIFGGGDMFPDILDPTKPPSKNDIDSNVRLYEKVGYKNTLIAHELIEKHGFKLTNHDVGGTQHRKVIFDIWSGNVWLRKGK